jgi:hypothetical protein
MITDFRIIKTESRNFVSVEEIQNHKQININYDIQLKNPIVATTHVSGRETNVLRVEYSSAINYINPTVGVIRFEGTVDYSGKEDLKELKQTWDSGEAPTDIRNEIVNVITANVMPLALILSKSMGLPPAVPLPIIDYKNPSKPRNEPTFYHG